MANELSSKDINVNAIAPGYMKTPLTQAMQDDPVRNKEVLDRLPIGYWGDPSVLQGPVVFFGKRSFRLYLRRDDSCRRRLAGALKKLSNQRLNPKAGFPCGKPVFSFVQALAMKTS